MPSVWTSTYAVLVTQLAVASCTYNDSLLNCWDGCFKGNVLMAEARDARTGAVTRTYKVGVG